MRMEDLDLDYDELMEGYSEELELIDQIENSLKNDPLELSLSLIHI